MTDVTLWGIHVGSTGDADGLFLDSSFVALGWPAAGDLQQLDKDRESFKKRVKPEHFDSVLVSVMSQAEAAIANWPSAA